MKKWKTRGISLFLALAVMAGLLIPAQAAVSQTDINAAVTDTAAYLQRAVSKLQVGSIGGEWAVLGLARSSASVPDSYFQNYYSTVEKYVNDCGGVLHERKYTEYSRVIVSLPPLARTPAVWLAMASPRRWATLIKPSGRGSTALSGR